MPFFQALAAISASVGYIPVPTLTDHVPATAYVSSTKGLEQLKTDTDANVTCGGPVSCKDYHFTITVCCASM